MNTKKLFCILLIGSCFCSVVYTQQSQNDKTKDEIIFWDYVNSMKNKTNDNLFLHTALYFLDVPYGYSTLEINEKEDLVVNLRELDCLTYIENVIALYRTVVSDSISFDYFKKELQNIRYRSGTIEGYASRLHYMTDWIFDNEIKKYIVDKTELIGGVKLPVNLYFMSKNYEKYDHLKRDPGEVAKIKMIEESINSREHYYIPKEQIPTIEKNINTGDIVCFTTKIGGLDVSHVGIAVWQEEVLTFIHASTKYKKIVVDPESLYDYCMNNRNITGIMVLKLAESK